jgi:hypothetical protein
MTQNTGPKMSPRESYDIVEGFPRSKDSLAARESLEEIPRREGFPRVKKFLAWPLDADSIYIKYKLELRVTGKQVTKTFIK